MNKTVIVVLLFAVGLFAQGQKTTYQAEETRYKDMRHYSFSHDLYGFIQLVGPQPEMIQSFLLSELKKVRGVRSIESPSPKVLSVVRLDGYEWADIEAGFISRIRTLVPAMASMARLPDVPYIPPAVQPLPFPLPLILGTQQQRAQPAQAPAPKLEPPQAPRPRPRQ
jgi:hypothetical protein